MAIEPIRPGADSRRNWKTINQILAEQSLQQAKASDHAAALAELRRRPLDTDGGFGDSQRFVIFTEEDDHLVCGMLGDEDVWSVEETLVAKEIPLRIAAKPSVDHEIRPPFAEQDPEGESLTGTVIFAVRPRGGTGLVIEDEAVEWLMLDDTRDWAYPLEYKDAADSCVLKRLWVKSSDVPEVV